MARIGYTVRLETDESRIFSPAGKVSGQARLDLSENQVRNLAENYQFSIVKKRVYDNDHSSPQNVVEYDQGEWRVYPNDEGEIGNAPRENGASTSNSDDGADESDDSDEVEYVEVDGVKIKKSVYEKQKERNEQVKEKYGDKVLDSPDEISDTNTDDNIHYCNTELSNGDNCKREVDNPDETCWQH